MSERKCKKICEGVNISCIKEEKFKTSRVSFTIFVPLKKATASLNAVVLGALERCCMKYPEFSSFNKRLEELYGASIYSSVSKIGEVQALTLSAVCINDNTSFDGSKVIADVITLLCDIIFNPCVEGNKFRDEDVNQSKRQLKECILSYYNDKKLYAKLRCEELMFQDEKYGISKYGKEEDVDKITPEDVFSAWKKLLESSHIEIMVLGSPDYDMACKLFSSAFSNIERKNIENCETVIKNSVESTREFTDTMDVVQCKLVMGFRTPYSAAKDNVFPVRLMSALLGGTPISKLFMNVREKLSLCYYCSSNFNKDKGVLFIESGVEKDNIDKAKDEILKQLDDIKNGNFTEEDLDATKMYLCQSFEKFNDSLGTLDLWYVSQMFEKEIKTPEECVKYINDVTRNQVIEVANNVYLDTIYTLVGNGGKNDED